jgi:hypothetical protein
MLGILAAWSVYWLFECDPLAVYLLHVLFWFLLDWILLSVVQVNIDECILLWIIDLNLYSSVKDGPLPFSKFEFVLGWFLRELTAPFLFLNALLRPAIRWKAGVYRLKWGGVVEEIKPTVKLWHIFLYYFSAIWFREHVTECLLGRWKTMIVSVCSTRKFYRKLCFIFVLYHSKHSGPFRDQIAYMHV